MTNKTTMPEPVARASVLMYLDRRQFLLAELGTEAAGELTWGEHDLITTDQAEAYADARVREALEEAAKTVMDAPITSGMLDDDGAKALSIHANSRIRALIKRID